MNQGGRPLLYASMKATLLTLLHYKRRELSFNSVQFKTDAKEKSTSRPGKAQ